MKKLFIGLLAAFCAIAGFGQPTPVQVVEATAAQVAAGTAGAPYYVSPRRLAVGGGPGVFTSITDTGLTSGRIVIVGTGGLLQDTVNLLYSSGQLTVTAASTPFVRVTDGTTTGAIDVNTGGSQVRFGSSSNSAVVILQNGGTALSFSTQKIATFVGAIVNSTDTLSGAGAVSVTKDTTKLTSTGVGDAITLANGTDGQIKRIIHDVDGGSMILTPTTKTGWSTATFTNAGDSLTLEYVTTRGWIVMGSYGTVVAP